MGIGYTIDTPLRLAPYGIDSVISLVDDALIERFRKLYSEKFMLPYQEISRKVNDYRAKRITAYLDLISDLAEQKFDEMKSMAQQSARDLRNYFELLPGESGLKEEFLNLKQRITDKHFLSDWLHKHMHFGRIDVNIMTKVDRENYRKGEKLPSEFNDAHAALRGFAESKVKSAVVLSAGMNPRLYGYFEQFDAFYPYADGSFNKQIVLKVSDYRSAVIQGKFLAKKGIWISEYRVESGLNCGGHAFATDGYLMGPILAEFRNNRKELQSMLFEILTETLKKKGRTVPEQMPELRITAQGGVGTSEEHYFLLDHYGVDSVGWGTPFMLVPEVVNIDNNTLGLLENAKENDLYLSNISPLGVPFNSLHNNTKDIEKQALIDRGTPGSSCPKHYVALNGEFTDKPICSASRTYQKLKIEHIKKQSFSPEKEKLEIEKATEKSCICVGLGTSSLLVNGLSTQTEGPGVSVCPGPNMAYFDRTLSLKEMVDHIYGRINVMNRNDRPHMFMKELDLYLNHLQEKVEEALNSTDAWNEKYFRTFFQNLCDGITYYRGLFGSVKAYFEKEQKTILDSINEASNRLQNLKSKLFPEAEKQEKAPYQA